MIYPAIYSLFALTGLTRRKASALLLWLALAFLLVFMGGRMDVGCDFATYESRFSYTPKTVDWTTLTSQTEALWQLLNILVRGAGLQFYWVNYLSSAIMLAGYGRLLRRLPNPMMALALLFPVILVQLGMSGVRQGIAVALLVWAAVDFVKGRRLLTAFWILVASQFHTSAIVFLPIALLAHSRFSTIRLVLAVAISTPIVALLIGERMEVYQNRYIDEIYGEMTSNGAIVRYILVAIPCALFVAVRKRMEEVTGANYTLLIVMACITASISLTGFVNLVVLHRLTFYVMPFSIVMWIYLSEYHPDHKLRTLVRYAPLAIYGGYLVFWVLLSRHARLCFTPYQNYLFSL